MNFSNSNFTFKDLRDCTLIMKNGTKIPVTIDYIETTADTFPKFEGHITGTAKVSYRNFYDIRNDAVVQRNTLQYSKFYVRNWFFMYSRNQKRHLQRPCYHCLLGGWN